MRRVLHDLPMELLDDIYNRIDEIEELLTNNRIKRTIYTIKNEYKNLSSLLEILIIFSFAFG